MWDYVPRMAVDKLFWEEGSERMTVRSRRDGAGRAGKCVRC